MITPLFTTSTITTNNLPLINATTDAEAIITFLCEYKDSPETLRSYTKEIERLLLWCIHVAKINLTGLRREHMLAYQEFLINPAPKKLWCGPNVIRTTKDGAINVNWRPFVKGLNNTSINKAIKIIDSFFNYLVQTNYLIGNPLALDRRRKKRHQARQIVDRYLTLEEIHTVLNALNNFLITQHKPNNNEKILDLTFKCSRARYIILLLSYTGLRIAEASKHRMGNFIERENNWFLRVIGKGKKLRDIPIPDELLIELAKFRQLLGLSKQPKFKEITPLIPQRNLIQPITMRRINQILKWAFELGARIFEPQAPHKASKLRAASAHWLRHSYVTFILNAGVPLKVAQENAGHSDLSTTMLYTHVSQIDRHAATKKLSLLSTDTTNN